MDRVAKGAHGKGRSSSRVLAASLQRACCLQVAGNLHGSFGFAPTRLNTADSPARDKPLPEAARHSIRTFLSDEQIAQLHSRQFSRAAADGFDSTFLSLFVFANVDACQSVSLGFVRASSWIFSIFTLGSLALLILWTFNINLRWISRSPHLPGLGPCWISFCSPLCQYNLI